MMRDRYETLFGAAGKHISLIENVAGIKLDAIKANELGHKVVDILDEGYELARHDHGTVAELVNNELYRKGLICEIDGIKFFHSSSTYVKVVENSDEYEFNLRNLPNFKFLNEFSRSILKFAHDSDVVNIMSHNSAISEACDLLQKHVEVIYWRKVAKSIECYHKSAKRDQQAREILAKSGFSEDEIEGYIPPSDLKVWDTDHE
tara:strand:+ start:25621 stop:26232 length:612 start_codon:yes stop_codon:yes gene_type:complete